MRSSSFKRRLAVIHRIATTAFVMIMPCAAANAQFITIDQPAVTYNIAWGVSNGIVVGYENYGDSGFTYDGTSFTTVNVPGASYTQLNGIAGSDLYGNYSPNVGPNAGFIYNGVAYTSVPDYPGSTSGTTVVNGGQGSTVVGSYIDSLGNINGYLYDTASHLFTPIDDPVTIGDPYGYTVVSGINGAATVGTYGLGSGTFGFIDSHGTFTTISDPLGVGYTTVSGGIGAYVVGHYIDSSYNYHGFIYDSYTNTYTTLDDSLANSQFGTNINGIGYNSSGGITVVGAYWDSSYNAHAFEYSYTPEPGAAGVLFAVGLTGIGIRLRRTRRRQR